MRRLLQLVLLAEFLAAPAMAQSTGEPRAVSWRGRADRALPYHLVTVAAAVAGGS